MKYRNKIKIQTDVYKFCIMYFRKTRLETRNRLGLDYI